MKKRILSIITMAALTLSMFAVFAPVIGAASGYTVGNTVGSIKWKIDTGTGVLTVESATTANAEIPAYTSSRPPWYEYRAHVGKIVLGDTITAIGNRAFSDFGNLKTVVVEGTSNLITRIGISAFSGCANLEDFFAADGTTLKKFAGPLFIDNSAFSGCAALKRLDISGLTTLGTGVFLGCKSLESIIGPTTGRYRIISADGNPIATGASGILVDFNTVSNPVRIIKAPVTLGYSTSGRYNIPDTVTTIEEQAFAYCTGLEEIVIPSSVTTIGNNAFAWGGILKTATFLGNAPSTTYFGTGVFEGANLSNQFGIRFLSGSTGWTTPTWRGYPSSVAASYVVLNRNTLVIEAGKTAQIQATVYPATAVQTVKWEIIDMLEPDGITPVALAGTNPIIAVEGSGSLGVVNGLRAGTATIEVTDIDGNATKCTVQVVNPTVAVTGVSIDRTAVNMIVGETLANPLSASVQPAGAANQELFWSSSNTNIAYITTTALPNNKVAVTAVAPGTAVITVRTADGNRSANCTVTVTGSVSFVPVTNITLSTASVATGARLNLNDAATVAPSNATHKNVNSWEIISATNSELLKTVITSAGELIPPWGVTGSVVVEAIITSGQAEATDSTGAPAGWGYTANVDYIKRFTISVVPFLPVTGITGVPSSAYVGVPLTLTGTVIPANASYKNIVWELENAGDTGAYIDPVNGTLIALKPGTLTVSAKVENAALSSTMEIGAQSWTFTIYVQPYSPNTLTLRAEPGGSVSGAGAGLFGNNEIVTITATPSVGYIFSGWYSTNGGFFADAGSSVTKFTMPGNSTTVTAYFSYTGLPGGGVSGSGGGPVLPIPVHYFTYGTSYTRGSGVAFAHVSLRSYNLFSRVAVDGITLSRYSHYNAASSDGYTVVTLANGYLDTLSQGAHMLTVTFSDGVTVTAAFNVVLSSYVSPLFNDVYSSDWYYADVIFVANRSWMTGRASQPNQFAPHSPVTQGEVVDALYYIAGRPSVINASGAVLQGRDASLQWALSAGIAPLGGAYNLNSAVARQDVALLLSRLAGWRNLSFPVVRDSIAFADENSINTGARSAVTALYRAGIMSGRASNMFAPLGNMTRAEFAAVLHRFALTVL